MGNQQRLMREGDGIIEVAIPHAPPPAKAVLVKTIQAGLLTDGSFYSPTPSQQSTHQRRALLASVPDHSGASVWELHPLPVNVTRTVIT